MPNMVLFAISGATWSSISGSVWGNSETSQSARDQTYAPSAQGVLRRPLSQIN